MYIYSLKHKGQGKLIINITDIKPNSLIIFALGENLVGNYL